METDRTNYMANDSLRSRLNYNTVTAVIFIVLVLMNFSTIKTWFGTEKPEIVEKVEEPPAEKPKAEPVKKEPVKKVAPAPKPKPKSFHIIAGSFKVESNATNYVETLKKQGYDSQIVGVRNGFHFVSFSSHETQAQANAEFKKITQVYG